MTVTTQYPRSTLDLRNTLAAARRLAQARGEEVICQLSGEQTTARGGDSGNPISGSPHRVLAIVRPDEPIIFCGMFPSSPAGSARLTIG